MAERFLCVFLGRVKRMIARVYRQPWRAEGLALWLSILDRCRWTAGSLDGVQLERGECLVSVRRLAESAAISYRRTRTLLTGAEKAGELTRKTTQGKTVLSVSRFNSYVKGASETDAETSAQGAENRRTSEAETDAIQHELKLQHGMSQHDLSPSGAKSGKGYRGKQSRKKKAGATEPSKFNAWGLWVDVCRAAGRDRDPVRTGPNLGAARELAKLVGVDVTADELRACMAAYLKDQDPFLSRNGHGLRYLPSRLDVYLTGNGKATKREAALAGGGEAMQPF